MKMVMIEWTKTAACLTQVHVVVLNRSLSVIEVIQ